MSMVIAIGNIYGLIFNCPFENALSGCPFASIRKKEVLERIYEVDKMAVDKITAMEQFHKGCLSARETIHNKYVSEVIELTRL
jgi:hypothetical protein